MARGWESKSVEEQLAERASTPAPQTEAKRSASRAQGDKLRAAQALELQREQILNQRTSNPHRRVALAAALEHVEKQLAELAQKH